MKTFRSSIVVAVLALGACAAPSVETAPPAASAEAASAPQVNVGDYWEYVVHDGWTKLPRGIYRYEVLRVDPLSVVVQLSNDGRVLDTLVYAPGWNGRELPLTNTQRFRYDPVYESYDYPLAPGKKWHNVVQSTDVATGRSYTTHVYGRVVGRERVRVPAGEFDALKVERSVFAGNMEGPRSQEEIQEIDWYAPSVRRAVRSSANSQHFDNSRGGGDGGGEYPLRVRGDFLVGELSAYSK